MKPKKIILIVIDTLRADHLGCYGYKRNTSPNIDNLAKEGVLFKYAFSPSSFTIPSHASIFTSKYPSSHTIGFDQTFSGKLNKDVDITLAEMLSSRDYVTAAFVSSMVLRKDTNLNAGFNLYDDIMTSHELNRQEQLIRDGSETINRALEWAKENLDKNFFLFVHFFDVHGPYVSPDPYNKVFVNDDFYNIPKYLNQIVSDDLPVGGIPGYQVLNTVRDGDGKLIDFEKDIRYYIAQYDGGIRYCDNLIITMLNKIKELGVYDDSLVIICSDHGEALCENNVFFYHGLSVTLDQIAIPLIIKPHKSWNIKRGTVNTPVSTIDIMPTILSLCDYDYRDIGIEGHSLRKMLEGKEDPILKERILISENEYQFALIHYDRLMELRKKETPTSTFYPNILALIDSLNGRKYCWDSGNEYVLAIPFDQYQRYKIVADIINKFRNGKQIFKILDVGAGSEEILKKFLTWDDIYLSDKGPPPEHKQKSNYIIGDITELDLDGTYDIVISIDTYEHINPVFRKKFINKLLNLSKIATIVAAPFDTPWVKEHEVIANELYKISHGKEYKWLHEHIQNGLPSLSFTLELIKKSGFNYTVIPNGYLPRWFEMISIYHLTEGMPEFSKSMDELYEFYNKNFYRYDNLNPAYRQVIIISKVNMVPDFSSIYTKNTEMDKNLSIKSEILQSFFVKIRELYSNHRYKELREENISHTELSSTLQARDAQITELSSTLQARDAQITELFSTLQARDAQITELFSTLQARDAQITELFSTLQARDAQITELSSTLQARDAQITELSSTLQARDAQTKDIETSLQEKNAQVTELTRTLQKEIHIQTMETHMLDKSTQVIDLLNKVLKAKDTQVANLTSALQAKDAQITELSNNMQQSIVWQLLMKYSRLIEALLPHGTYRRRYYDRGLFWIRGGVHNVKNLEQKNKAIISRFAQNKTQTVDIICFPIINWDFRYQRSQHLLSRFAKNGYRVFYLTVDPIPFKQPYYAREIEQNVLELKLSISSKFNVYEDVLSKEQIDSLLKSLSMVKRDFNIDRALSLVEFPNWEPLVSKLKEIHGWKIIYDCMDEHTDFSNVNISVSDKEAKLFKESDMAIVTSNHLHKKAKTYRKDVFFIPNAGDFEHFNKLPENGLLANIRRPIIGYYGAIAEWFDSELVEFLAANRKNWNFVFIGHTFGSNIKKLQALPNVHLLGEKPYAELPKYLYWFDVCIIPFKLIPLIEATHPVKFYEYLGSGKPVVSMKLPELLPYSDLCYIAENKEEFLKKIEIALKENNPEIKNKRIEFAKNNTWDDRYSILIANIEKLHERENIK